MCSKNDRSFTGLYNSVYRNLFILNDNYNNAESIDKLNVVLKHNLITQVKIRKNKRDRF